MGKDFILGAALLVVGGLLTATAITGNTGSFVAVFLAPGALSIINPVAGTFRSAGNGKVGASPTEPGNPKSPAEPKGPIAPTSTTATI